MQHSVLNKFDSRGCEYLRLRLFACEHCKTELISCHHAQSKTFRPYQITHRKKDQVTVALSFDIDIDGLSYLPTVKQQDEHGNYAIGVPTARKVVSLSGNSINGEREAVITGERSYCPPGCAFLLAKHTHFVLPVIRSFPGTTLSVRSRPR